MGVAKAPTKGKESALWSVLAWVSSKAGQKARPRETASANTSAPAKAAAAGR